MKLLQRIRRALRAIGVAALVAVIVFAALLFLRYFEALSVSLFDSLTVSLVFGTIATAVFYEGLRCRIDYPPDPTLPSIPSWLTGFVERFVFTAAIGLTNSAEAPITPVAMLAWLGLKMAAGWTRRVEIKGPKPTAEGEERRAQGAILALLTGLISMAFAFVGGLLWRD
jgi:hypothetical protein